MTSCRRPLPTLLALGSASLTMNSSQFDDRYSDSSMGELRHSLITALPKARGWRTRAASTLSRVLRRKGPDRSVQSPPTSVIQKPPSGHSMPGYTSLVWRAAVPCPSCTPSSLLQSDDMPVFLIKKRAFWKPVVPNEGNSGELG